MITIYNNDEASTITNYKEKLASVSENIPNSYNGHFYIGYPTPRIETEGLGEFLALLVIEEYGVFVFYDSDKRKQNEERFLINIVSKVEELYLNKDKYIYYIKIDDITVESFSNNYLSNPNEFNINLFNKFISSIQHMYNLRNKDERLITNVNSLGNDIKKRNEALKILDKEQYKMINSTIDSHIRIRGLAGSGKTIIMTQKLAQLHYNEPQKVIVYTYMTKTLGEFVKKLFENAYMELSGDKPNYTKVKIMHAWGSNHIMGLYREICLNNNIVPQALIRNGQFNSFADICSAANSLVRNTIYDYVFIDEAQDFPLSFFQLVKSSLNNAGRIIYAYDEMQTLNENALPSKLKIFGRDVVNDINLEKSYRTPLEILVGAHAIGLGIYNNSVNETLQLSNFVEDDTIWETIGYTLDPAKPKAGKQISMYRTYSNDEKCNDQSGLETVTFYEANAYDDAINFTISDINKLMKEQEIVPEDILIIDLDSSNYKINYNKFNFTLWNEKEQFFNINLVGEDSDLTFRIKNSIPYTSINRSKGNEAAIIYLLNCDANSSSESYWRRKIFTAMTRSKHIVRMIGRSEVITRLKDEYEKVKSNNFILKFKYPTKEEKKNIFTIAKSDENDEYQIDKSVQTFEKIKSNSVDKALDLLARQLGINKEELPSEIVDIVKKGTDNEQSN